MELLNKMEKFDELKGILSDLIDMTEDVIDNMSDMEYKHSDIIDDVSFKIPATIYTTYHENKKRIEMLMNKIVKEDYDLKESVDNLRKALEKFEKSYKKSYDDLDKISEEISDIETPLDDMEYIIEQKEE
jgi:wobble nucleotide-excising tRNase